MKVRGKKILVTGGAGFVGSHIVESLVKAGADVIVFDNFSTGKKTNLDLVKKDVKIIKGDILDYRALEKACRGADAVSHQAAQLEIFRSLDDPADDLATNTIGTLNVLKAAHKHGIGKVVNASSACVYGQAQYTPEDEGHRHDPNWPYGVSKLAAEKYCSIFNQDHGMSITNLRYGIVYGEREWFGRVLTIFLKRALENKPPVVFGDGSQMRDFVYVKDIVSAHNLCLAADNSYDTFNVATGRGTPIRDLAHLVSSLFLGGTPPVFENVKEGGMSRHVRGRRRIPAELKQMVLDPSRIKNKLGWEPRMKLEDGVRVEMDWLRAHPGDWKIESVIRV